MSLISIVKKWMEQDGLNPAYLEDSMSEYYANKKIDPENRKEFGFHFLTYRRYQGLLSMCKEFAQYFDVEEFSKLFCKKLASYTYVHSAYLTTNPTHYELCVKSFATPSKQLPSFLEVSCSREGVVKKSVREGIPPLPIRF